MREMARQGTLLPTDLIWHEGMPRWIPAKEARGLEFATGARTAPPSGIDATASPSAAGHEPPPLPRARQPGPIRYACGTCAEMIESPGHLRGQRDVCPCCGTVTPVPADLGPASEQRKSALPKVAALATIAAALVAVVSLLCWQLLRDTWERDHGQELRTMCQEIAALVAAGKPEAAAGRLEELEALLGERTLEDPSLREAVEQASASAAAGRAALLAEREAEAERQKEAERRRKLAEDETARQRRLAEVEAARERERIAAQAEQARQAAEARARIRSTIRGFVNVDFTNGRKSILPGERVFLLEQRLAPGEASAAAASDLENYVGRVAAAVEANRWRWQRTALETPLREGMEIAFGGAATCRSQVHDLGVDVHLVHMTLRLAQICFRGSTGGSSDVYAQDDLWPNVIRLAAVAEAQVQRDGTFAFEAIGYGTYVVYAVHIEGNLAEWCLEVDVTESGVQVVRLTNDNATIHDFQ